ncbi:hypothetical protein FISHEDRAFT_58779 [Fistulina hepatica ATCC 64428]|uniref:Uncharacterized protein n=1 Tax=Fistulina hepatica ATCC 64428 TaxID=1128425 RepID=A0A0D7AD73_9AGAR|nr:hypothetical protein FISHEDRAFT_58779 [Fistulina hepatica ATCC 64428]
MAQRLRDGAYCLSRVMHRLCLARRHSHPAGEFTTICSGERAVEVPAVYSREYAIEGRATYSRESIGSAPADEQSSGLTTSPPMQRAHSVAADGHNSSRTYLLSSSRGLSRHSSRLDTTPWYFPHEFDDGGFKRGPLAESTGDRGVSNPSDDQSTHNSSSSHQHWCKTKDGGRAVTVELPPGVLLDNNHFMQQLFAATTPEQAESFINRAARLKVQ